MIRTSSCRQDGRTVFIGDAHHLRLEVGMQSDLVANSRCEQITGRHATFLAIIRPHRIHGLVTTAVNGVVIDKEVIATDTVQRRGRTCVDTRMADSRHCGDIVDQTIVATITFLDQTLEAILTKLVVVSAKIVPSHLVDYNAHNKFGALIKIRMRQSKIADAHRHYEKQQNLFHFFFFVCMNRSVLACSKIRSAILALASSTPLMVS